METHRVVTLARQRPDAVVVIGFEGLGDRVGQRRVRADFDEGGVLLGGGGDGLVQAHRLPHVGDQYRHPASAWRRCVGCGGDERDRRRLRRQIGQRRAKSRQDRVHQRGVRGDFHVHPPREALLRARRRRSPRGPGHRTGDHGLPRREEPGQAHSGKSARNFSAASASISSSATAPCPASRDISRPGTDDPQSLVGSERTGDHRRGHLPHRMSNHRIGFHAVGTPQRGQRQLQTHQHRLDSRIAGHPPPSVSTCCSENRMS